MIPIDLEQMLHIFCPFSSAKFNQRRRYNIRDAQGHERIRHEEGEVRYSKPTSIQGHTGILQTLFNGQSAANVHERRNLLLQITLGSAIVLLRYLFIYLRCSLH